MKNNKDYKLKILDKCMRLREIRIDGGLKLKEIKSRQAIQANLGKEAIIYDSHYQWCHGQLLTTGYDHDVYRIKIFDARQERQLHYHDLERLMICSPTNEDRKETGDFRKLL